MNQCNYSDINTHVDKKNILSGQVELKRMLKNSNSWIFPSVFKPISDHTFVLQRFVTRFSSNILLIAHSRKQKIDKIPVNSYNSVISVVFKFVA